MDKNKQQWQLIVATLFFIAAVLVAVGQPLGTTESYIGDDFYRVEYIHTPDMAANLGVSVILLFLGAVGVFALEKELI